MSAGARPPLPAARGLDARLLHELGNATFAMTSSLELLACELDGASTHPALAGALAGARRVEALLHDFGELTRPLTLRLTRELLGDLLDEARGAIEVRVEARELAWVRCDRARLAGALQTLIHAAGGELGPCHAALSVSALDARLTLTGPGSGTPAARLFEPFARRGPAESGLSLALARRVIEAHGGAVTARGDGGLSVDVELPLA